MTTKAVYKSMKDVIIGLQSSRMNEQEKMMRMAMMPHMSDDQLTQLASLLKKEASVYVDAYLEKVA